MPFYPENPQEPMKYLNISNFQNYELLLPEEMRLFRAYFRLGLSLFNRNVYILFKPAIYEHFPIKPYL
jgi:hypothetical protein